MTRVQRRALRSPREYRTWWDRGSALTHQIGSDDWLADLADEALAANDYVIRDGIVAIPDVILLEGMAHGYDTSSTWIARRADGRAVHFFQMP